MTLFASICGKRINRPQRLLYKKALIVRLSDEKKKKKDKFDF